MRALIETNAGVALEIDACRSCHLFWFDPHELDQVPTDHPQRLRPESQLPPELREKLALAKIDHIRRQANRDDEGHEWPVEPWKAAAALLGMPVEEDNAALIIPWITLAVCTICAAAFGLSLWLGLPLMVREWGLIPAEPLRHGGLTWITSFFLHGGWMHLLGNLYFLWVFGDNVEECLGRTRYLLLIVIAAAVGDFGHCLLEPRSTVPSIGASGGISGVIVYYALRFPGARLGFIMNAWLGLRWIVVPAWVLLLIWLALQGFGVWQQLTGSSNISSLAHLGGALVGLVFCLVRKV